MLKSKTLTPMQKFLLELEHLFGLAFNFMFGFLLMINSILIFYMLWMQGYFGLAKMVYHLICVMFLIALGYLITFVYRRIVNNASRQ